MVISNAIVCDVHGEREVDVRIENGVICEVGQNLKDKNILDAKGKYLLPSLIDTNVRLKDSNLNAKNIKMLSKDAIKGGVGHIVLNADSTPSIDNEIVLEYAQNSMHNLEGAKIDFMLNTLQEDASLSNIATLLKSGAVAPYMSTIAKNNIAIKIAEYVQMYKVTLFCKAEDNSLIHSGVMLDGDVSAKLGLAGIPDLSEVLHVSRMIEIARHFKIKILFKSIASPRSIFLITQAKEDGVDISCEVSIAHLTCSDESCEDFNTTAKIDPPLASKRDVKLLQKALRNNQIDILTTLHQPSSVVNKEVAFFDAENGSESISEALPLYYTKFVKNKIISMNELIKLTVQNPAKSIGLEAGIIEVGKQANLILFDKEKSFTLNNTQSLFNGDELFGEILNF